MLNDFSVFNSGGQPKSFTGASEAHIINNSREQDHYLPKSTSGLSNENSSDRVFQPISTTHFSYELQESINNSIRYSYQHYEVSRILKLMASTGLMRQKMAELLGISRQSLHKILSYKTEKIRTQLVDKISYIKAFVAAVPEKDRGLIGLHIEGDANHLVNILANRKASPVEAASFYNEAVNIELFEFEPMKNVIENPNILPKAIPAHGE